jgi:hypothetical protein
LFLNQKDTIMLLQVLFFIFLTHVNTGKASEKTGDNNCLQVPKGAPLFDALHRSESWPSEALPTTPPKQTGQNRFTRGRLASTHSAPPPRRSSGPESGYNTHEEEETESSGSEDDNDVWYQEPSSRGPQSGEVNLRFWTLSSNISPTPEVAELQELCLRRLTALTDKPPAGLNAPTMFTTWLIEKENSLANLAFIAAELQEAYIARQTARELRTTIKPLKFVRFPKQTHTVEIVDYLYKDLTPEEQAKLFQNSLELMKARFLAQPHNALTDFYMQESAILLPEDLMPLIVDLMEDDEKIKKEDKVLKITELMYITRRLQELTLKAK